MPAAGNTMLRTHCRATACAPAGCRRLVDNPLGHIIKNHARTSGMDISEVLWVPYDGVGRADRVGLNFTEVGIGVRASVTLYDRGHTAVAHMKPGDVDWKRIFGAARACGGSTPGASTRR